jgi:hypothetical protein
MTREELQVAVESAIDNATVSGDQIDAAIKIVVDACAVMADDYSTEDGDVPAVIAHDIRALMPEGGT